MPFLNEQETHWCDLPITGQTEYPSFMPKYMPTGRRWQCDQCQRIWVVKPGRTDGTNPGSWSSWKLET